MRLSLLLLFSIPFFTLAQMPLIVAHRGASHAAPENTLPAFRLAWEEGADAIEGDFFLSGDKQIVCIHDTTTKNLADRSLIVRESTVAELKTLDVGARTHDRFRGTRIPTLPEVLAIVPADKKIFVEIKDGPHILPHLLVDLQKSGLNNHQIVIISFNEDVIRLAKQTMPQYAANLLVSIKSRNGQPSPTATELIAKLRKLNADGLSINYAGFEPELAQTIKAAGFGFHVWTVNSAPAAKQLRDAGVDSITTDTPNKIRTALTPTPQP